MNTNTSRSGAPLPTCPGSGAPSTGHRALCPECHYFYRTTKQGTIRAHVSKRERSAVNHAEGHEAAQRLIEEMRQRYGQEVSA